MDPQLVHQIVLNDRQHSVFEQPSRPVLGVLQTADQQGGYVRQTSKSILKHLKDNLRWHLLEYQTVDSVPSRLNSPSQPQNDHILTTPPSFTSTVVSIHPLPDAHQDSSRLGDEIARNRVCLAARGLLYTVVLIISSSQRTQDHRMSAILERGGLEDRQLCVSRPGWTAAEFQQFQKTLNDRLYGGACQFYAQWFMHLQTKLVSLPQLPVPQSMGGSIRECVRLLPVDTQITEKFARYLPLRGWLVRCLYKMAYCAECMDDQQTAQRCLWVAYLQLVCHLNEVSQGAFSQDGWWWPWHGGYQKKRAKQLEMYGDVWNSSVELLGSIHYKLVRGWLLRSHNQIKDHSPIYRSGSRAPRGSPANEIAGGGDGSLDHLVLSVHAGESNPVTEQLMSEKPKGVSFVMLGSETADIDLIRMDQDEWWPLGGQFKIANDGLVINTSDGIKWAACQVSGHRQALANIYGQQEEFWRLMVRQHINQAHLHHWALDRGVKLADNPIWPATSQPMFYAAAEASLHLSDPLLSSQLLAASMSSLCSSANPLATSIYHSMSVDLLEKQLTEVTPTNQHICWYLLGKLAEIYFSQSRHRDALVVFQQILLPRYRKTHHKRLMRYVLEWVIQCADKLDDPETNVRASLELLPSGVTAKTEDRLQVSQRLFKTQTDQIVEVDMSQITTPISVHAYWRNPRPTGTTMEYQLFIDCRNLPQQWNISQLSAEFSDQQYNLTMEGAKTQRVTTRTHGFETVQWLTRGVDQIVLEPETVVMEGSVDLSVTKNSQIDIESVTISMTQPPVRMRWPITNSASVVVAAEEEAGVVSQMEKRLLRSSQLFDRWLYVDGTQRTGRWLPLSSEGHRLYLPKLSPPICIEFPGISSQIPALGGERMPVDIQITRPSGNFQVVVEATEGQLSTEDTEGEEVNRLEMETDQEMVRVYVNFPATATKCQINCQVNYQSMEYQKTAEIPVIPNPLTATVKAAGHLTEKGRPVEVSILNEGPWDLTILKAILGSTDSTELVAKSKERIKYIFWASSPPDTLTVEWQRLSSVVTSHLDLQPPLPNVINQLQVTSELSQPVATVGEPLLVTYRLWNPTKQSMRVECLMHAAEGMVFGGPRRILVHVVAGYSKVLKYNMLPIRAEKGGWNRLPRLEIRIVGKGEDGIVRYDQDSIFCK